MDTRFILVIFVASLLLSLVLLTLAIPISLLMLKYGFLTMWIILFVILFLGLLFFNFIEEQPEQSCCQ
jgi:ABC-type transport system involved in cytochrome c biogenesis permease component